MSESMIERVARAIQMKLDDEFAERGGLAADEMADMAARAAIEAMREPTDAMVDTGSANIAPWWSPAMRNSVDFGNTKKAAFSSFNGMIDTALSEEPQ